MGLDWSKQIKRNSYDRFKTFRQAGQLPKFREDKIKNVISEQIQRLQQVISGEDNNPIKIQNNQTYPYCAVGRVEAHFASNDFTLWSTGCLVKGDIVVTCAHNCYSRKQRERPDSIWFHPSYKDKNVNPYKIKVIKTFNPVQYENDQVDDKSIDKNIDYAYLQLEQNLANTHGYLGIDFYTTFNQTQNKLIMGYPNEEGSQLTIFVGKIIDKNGLLQHTMNTISGIGGGPIVEVKDGQLYVIGLHSFAHKNVVEKGGIKFSNNTKNTINKDMNSEEIHLQANQILGNKSKYFDEFVKKDWSQITTLELDKNKIDTKRIKDIASTKLAYIKSISLKNNFIDAKAANQLVKIQWSFLQKLYLSGNPLRKEGIEILSKNKWINLYHLSIDECSLRDDGAKAFFLSNWNCLQEVNLSRNQIKEEGISFIEKCHLKLKVLLLDGNSFGSNGLKLFIKGQFQELQNLSLKSNRLQNGISQLCKGKWPNLKQLDLSLNEVENEGIKHFCLGDWSRLQQLLLRGNRIGDVGIQYILKHKWSLKMIDLQLNFIQANNIPEYRNQLLQLLKDATVLL